MCEGGRGQREDLDLPQAWRAGVKPLEQILPGEAGSVLQTVVVDEQETRPFGIDEIISRPGNISFTEMRA